MKAMKAEDSTCQHMTTDQGDHESPQSSAPALPGKATTRQARISQNHPPIEKDKRMQQANKHRSVKHQAHHPSKYPSKPATHGAIKAAWSIGSQVRRQLTSTRHWRLKGHRPQPWNGNPYVIGSLPDPKTYPDPDPNVLEVWSVVEDLLLRINRLCPVSVVQASDGRVHLVLAGFKDGLWEGVDLQLRYAILDTQRYHWCQNSHSGTFVEFLSYREPDLLLTLTPLTSLRHWPQADELHSRVTELLRRFPQQDHFQGEVL